MPGGGAPLPWSFPRLPGRARTAAGLPVGASIIDATVTPGGGRFATDFPATTIPEGVWQLIVTQNSLLGEDLSIGVR